MRYCQYCQLRHYFVFVLSDLASFRNFFQRPFQKSDPSDHFHMRSSSSATPVLLLPPIQTICLRSTTRVTRKLLVSRLGTEARSLLLQLWFASHPGPFTLQCALEKLTLTLLINKHSGGRENCDQGPSTNDVAMLNNKGNSER